jgi:tetratricopeptide (TPR) repeat protein
LEKIAACFPILGKHARRHGSPTRLPPFPVALAVIGLLLTTTVHAQVETTAYANELSRFERDVLGLGVSVHVQPDPVELSAAAPGRPASGMAVAEARISDEARDRLNARIGALADAAAAITPDGLADVQVIQTVRWTVNGMAWGAPSARRVTDVMPVLGRATLQFNRPANAKVEVEIEWRVELRRGVRSAAAGANTRTWSWMPWSLDLPLSDPRQRVSPMAMRMFLSQGKTTVAVVQAAAKSFPGSIRIEGPERAYAGGEVVLHAYLSDVPAGPEVRIEWMAGKNVVSIGDTLKLTPGMPGPRHFLVRAVSMQPGKRTVLAQQKHVLDVLPPAGDPRIGITVTGPTTASTGEVVVLRAALKGLNRAGSYAAPEARIVWASQGKVLHEGARFAFSPTQAGAMELVAMAERREGGRRVILETARHTISVSDPGALAREKAAREEAERLARAQAERAAAARLAAEREARARAEAEAAAQAEAERQARLQAEQEAAERSAAEAAARLKAEEGAAAKAAAAEAARLRADEEARARAAAEAAAKAEADRQAQLKAEQEAQARAEAEAAAKAEAERQATLKAEQEAAARAAAEEAARLKAEQEAAEKAAAEEAARAKAEEEAKARAEAERQAQLQAEEEAKARAEAEAKAEAERQARLKAEQEAAAKAAAEEAARVKAEQEAAAKAAAEEAARVKAEEEAAKAAAAEAVRLKAEQEAAEKAAAEEAARLKAEEEARAKAAAEEAARLKAEEEAAAKAEAERRAKLKAEQEAAAKAEAERQAKAREEALMAAKAEAELAAKLKAEKEAAAKAEAERQAKIKAEEEARAAAEKARIEDAQRQFAKAQNLVAAGKLDEGIAEAKAAAELDPALADASAVVQRWTQDKDQIAEQIVAAKAAIEKRDYNAAVRAVAEAAKDHPQYAPVVAVQADLEHLRQFLDHAKDEVAAGRAAEKAGDLKQALTHYEAAYEMVPDKALGQRIADVRDRIAQHEAQVKAALEAAERAATLAAQGRSQEASGDLKGAIAAYEASLKIQPDADLSRKVAGLKAKVAAQEAAEKAALEAAAEAERQANLKAKKAREAVEEARRLEQAGDLPGAIAKYTESMGYDADAKVSAQIELLRARHAAAQAAAAEARARAEKARVRLELADGLIAEGQLDEAIAKAQEAAELDPANADAARLARQWSDEKQEAIGQIANTRAALEAYDYDAALAALQKAQERHPRYAPVLEAQIAVADLRQKTEKAKALADAAALLEKQGDLDGAIQRYGDALAIVPNAALVARIKEIKDRQVAEALAAQAAAETAAREKAEAEQKAFDDAIKQARAALADYDVEAARAAAQKASELRPDDPALKDVQSALASTEETLARFQALVKEGYAHEDRKEWSAAIEKYQAAQKLVPDDDLAKRVKELQARMEAEARVLLEKQEAERKAAEGKARAEQKAFDDAIRAARSAIAQFDTGAAATALEQARGLRPDAAVLKDVESALGSAEQAVASSQALIKEGYGLESQGELGEALARYQAAVKLVPDDVLERRIGELQGRIAKEKAEREAAAKALLEQQAAEKAEVERQAKLKAEQEAAAREAEAKAILEEQARVKKEAAAKLAEARQLVAAGRLEEGALLAAEAARLDPDATEAEALAVKWTAERRTVMEQVVQARTWMAKYDAKKATIAYQAAKRIHPQFPPVVELGIDLEKLKRNMEQAQADIDAGYALEKEGDLAGAMAKYEGALALVPDVKISSHLAVLRAKQAEADAQRMVDDGYRLEQDGNIAGAIEKYEAALRLAPDERLAKRVEELKASAP